MKMPFISLLAVLSSLQVFAEPGPRIVGTAVYVHNPAPRPVPVVIPAPVAPWVNPQGLVNRPLAPVIAVAIPAPANNNPAVVQPVQQRIRTPELVSRNRDHRQIQLEDIPLGNLNTLSPPGRFSNEVGRLLRDFERIDPRYQKQRMAKTLGRMAAASADYVNVSPNDPLYGQQDTLKDIAQELLNMATGQAPNPQNIGRNVYEFITGRNFITTQPLTREQRVNAFLSFLRARNDLTPEIGIRIFRKIYEGTATRFDGPEYVDIQNLINEADRAAPRPRVAPQPIRPNPRPPSPPLRPVYPEVAILVPIAQRLLPVAEAIIEIGSGIATVLAPGEYPVIRVPHGDGRAVQDLRPDALAMRQRVENGETLYRLGTRNINETGRNAQYWSLENPNTPNYPGRHGIPAANHRNADFIERATLRPNSSFITKKVDPFINPISGEIESPGGGYEVIIERGGAHMEGHHAL